MKNLISKIRRNTARLAVIIGLAGVGGGAVAQPFQSLQRSPTNGVLSVTGLPLTTSLSIGGPLNLTGLGAPTTSTSYYLTVNTTSGAIGTSTFSGGGLSGLTVSVSAGLTRGVTTSISLPQITLTLSNNLLGWNSASSASLTIRTLTLSDGGFLTPSGGGVAIADGGAALGVVTSGATWTLLGAGMYIYGNYATLAIGDTGGELYLSGKTLSLSGNFTTTGAFPLTFAVSSTTSLILPTTGTLASLANVSGSLSSYLPLAGGVLTGELTGTSATFTSLTNSGAVSGILVADSTGKITSTTSIVTASVALPITLTGSGTFSMSATTSISGGGLISLGGFTLTVPATGTAGLLGTAQTWSQANTFSNTLSLTGQFDGTNGIRLASTGSTSNVLKILSSTQSAARTLTLSLDTSMTVTPSQFPYLNAAQTFTAANTFSSAVTFSGAVTHSNTVTLSTLSGTISLSGQFDGTNGLRVQSNGSTSNVLTILSSTQSANRTLTISIDAATTLTFTGGLINATSLTTSIPVGNLAAGSGASSSTFWRGDGTWATPASNSGTVTQVTAGAGLTVTNTTSTPALTLTTSIPVGNLNAGSGASSSTYWRGDGTWATVSGGNNAINLSTSTGIANTASIVSALGITTTFSGSSMGFTSSQSGGVLTLSGSPTISGSGTITMAATSALTLAAGNNAISGGLDVSGTAFISAITLTNSATVSGQLTIVGTAQSTTSLNGTMKVAGGGSFQKNIVVGGAIIGSGTLAVSGLTTLNSGTLAGTLSLTGQVKMTGILTPQESTGYFLQINTTSGAISTSTFSPITLTGSGTLSMSATSSLSGGGTIFLNGNAISFPSNNKSMTLAAWGEDNLFSGTNTFSGNVIVTNTSTFSDTNLTSAYNYMANVFQSGAANFTGFNEDNNVVLLTVADAISLLGVSDQRVKTNIVPFTAGASIVNAIVPIRFNFTGVGVDGKPDGRDTKTEHLSVSAQDIQKILPEAVSTLPNGTLSVDDRALLMAALNNLKELNAQVAILTASLSHPAK